MTKRANAEELQRDAKATWDAIKADWYGLDHLYLQKHPASLFQRIVLKAPYPPMYVPLVPTAALHQQYDFVRAYYTKPDNARRLDRRYPYLNEATMSRFVSESAEDIASMLSHLGSPAATVSGDTALTLLDAERLRPYEWPLGDDPDSVEDRGQRDEPQPAGERRYGGVA